MINKLFSPTFKLENARVMITPLKLEHFEPLSEIALNEKIWLGFPVFNCTNKETFKLFFDDALQNKEKKIHLPLALFDK